jgi:protoheme IX farnesyltransferase
MDKSIIGRLSILAEIVKIKITVLVMLTTLLGYLLATNEVTISLIYPSVGIFLLACGSAALNQYQERSTDVLMERTMDRPIPSGRIRDYNVLIISIIFLIAGSFLLFIKTNLITLFIGLLAFFWYNGVYTLLKKKTAYAVIPGSLIGALPPIAGWTAAGDYVFDFDILFISFYFFVWQIPHFWLLLLIYDKEYEMGGLPTLTKIFGRKSLINITFVLILFTLLIAMLIPYIGIINYNISSILLTIVSFSLLYFAIGFLRSPVKRKDVLKMFVSINVYTLIIITLLSLDKLIKLSI